MMTKKTMTILSVFMIVALTAVGFAAWLIVGTIEADTTGSFVSNELEDKYFKVEVNFDNDGTVDDDKGKLVFGRPDDAYVYENGSWLSYSNADPKEKLTATATVKFIPDAGFNEEEGLTMDYFLKEVIEDADGTPEKTQHRTIRVAIDIVEALTDAGELDPTSDNYKWFDWAVELGYIQYPTAKYISNGVAAEKALTWGKLVVEDGKQVVKALTDDELEDGVDFENNFLFIDLEYNMFTIDDSTKKFATAEIKIDFAWGEKVNEINPYKHFATISDPESEITVANYLKVTEGTPNNTYEFLPTRQDDLSTDDIDEANLGADEDSKIRNKDLAQRMLDYLRDYLNYDETNESGIQFSIVLSEGTPVEVE